MDFSFLLVLLAIGVVGTLVVALVVFGVVMMVRSENRKSDDLK